MAPTGRRGREVTQTPESSVKPVQPSLHELLAEYLHRQTQGHAAGLGGALGPDEVEPFEAVPVQPVDPRLAWDEARVALRCFGSAEAARSCKALAEWPGLVAAQEPVAALAFCAGNFPQRV